MDVEEIQTSLAQKPTILKPLQINQVVNKILQSAILPKKINFYCFCFGDIMLWWSFYIHKINPWFPYFLRNSCDTNSEIPDFPDLCIFPLTWVLDFPGRHQPDTSEVVLVWQYHAVVALKTPCGGKTIRVSRVWRTNAERRDQKVAAPSDFQSAGGREKAPKMVNGRSGRSVSQADLDQQVNSFGWRSSVSCWF